MPHPCSRLDRRYGVLLLSVLVACGSVPKSRTAPADFGPPPAYTSHALARPSPAGVESSAVAARFIEPQVTYSTPAFQHARTSFTTQAELQQLMRAWAQASPGAAAANPSLISLGVSQQGVPIEALLWTLNASAKPEALVRSARPTVLFVGQQHGDEPVTAEALLVLAQRLSVGGDLHSMLERINVLILPRANPDGAAKDDPLSANGVDINRDHLALRTPEAQAIARLMREFQPTVAVDVHEYAVDPLYVKKFGAAQGLDAMVQYATPLNGSEFTTKAAEEWFRRAMLSSLKQQGLTVDWHHSTSESLDDKTVSMGGLEADTARNVFGLRNAVSFMIETRGVGLGREHLKRRMHSQLTMMSSVLRTTFDRASELLKVRQYVDSSVQAQACRGSMVTSAQLTPSEYTLPMLNPDTGADQAVELIWNSALVLSQAKTIQRPCGYWLAPDQALVVASLRQLGIKVYTFSQARSLQRPEHLAGTGRANLGVDKLPGGEQIAYGDGYYVTLSQPLANLVVAALDTTSAAGYVTGSIISSEHSVARVPVQPNGKLTLVP